MKTMTVFETTTRWEYEPGSGGTVSIYRGARTPAVELARQSDPETLGVPSGGTITECSVYACELEISSPKASIMALLNGESKPKRIALVHGTLPLPFQDGSGE